MNSSSAAPAAVRVIEGELPGILILEPRVFGDARGFFFESYNERTMAEAGIGAHFVQDNHSLSARGVLRGLHYQLRQPQGKLIRVVTGEIFDVAVDLRQSSAAFGKWCGALLSGESKRMLWIPAGFAHGFHVLSESAHVLYKATDYYSGADEHCIVWNDPDLAIDWRLAGLPTLSPKDASGLSFRDAAKFP
ncbi:MAG TPA: dTDP-4-dehydrorhamnose 3,5-epimerase [Terriglobales bacterium]|nr:dTDP-4-dehydrorhamnose 3,5-epimerase [Terriglobales bacterium]